MRYRDAKKLHNGDEIILKETNEVSTVVKTEVYPDQVIVYAMTPKYGYCSLRHTDFK